MDRPSRSDFMSVQQILSGHVGPANPVTKDEITAQAGFKLADGRPDRRRTELILELYRDEFPFLVVGSGSGMYVAEAPEDLNREYRRRRAYIRSIASGWRALREQARRRGWIWNQGRFELPARRDFLFDLPPANPDPHRWNR